MGNSYIYSFTISIHNLSFQADQPTAFLAPTGAQGVRMSVHPAHYAQHQFRAVNHHLSRSEST